MFHRLKPAHARAPWKNFAYDLTRMVTIADDAFIVWHVSVNSLTEDLLAGLCPYIQGNGIVASHQQA